MMVVRATPFRLKSRLTFWRILHRVVPDLDVGSVGDFELSVARAKRHLDLALPDA